VATDERIQGSTPEQRNSPHQAANISPAGSATNFPTGAYGAGAAPVWAAAPGDDEVQLVAMVAAQAALALSGTRLRAHFRLAAGGVD